MKCFTTLTTFSVYNKPMVLFESEYDNFIFKNELKCEWSKE